MPDDRQINETLLYVKNTSPVEIDKLFPDDRKLIQDARDFIETARLVVQEKNTDELLQNFVWHTRDVDVSQAKKDPDEVLPVDKSKAKDDGRNGEIFHVGVRRPTRKSESSSQNSPSSAVTSPVARPKPLIVSAQIKRL
jgi:hypothetical protein